MIPFGLTSLMTVSMPMTRRLAKCLVPGYSALYWFNEGAGTVLADYSGNGNHGTLGAGAAAPTRTQYGLSFDGGDSVSLGSVDIAGRLSTGFSVTGVINPTGATTGGIIEIGRGAAAVTLGLRAVANKGYLYAGVSTKYVATADGALPASTWTEFSGTHTWGGAATTYINGAQHTTSPLASTYAVAAENWNTIGGYSGFLFTGGIAAILLYPVALTPAQIAQNHAVLKALLAPRGIALA